jgi:hypothetical protein
MREATDRAVAAIDAAHRADPRSHEGVPYELFYADRMVAWVRRLVGEPDPALLLAARAQHFERWAIPRESHPKGRGGYLLWRIDVHRRQGERVGQLLEEAGCDEATRARVAALVSKSAPRGDAGAQALEDAACLVFLESELATFLKDYPREKTVEILRKTWRKMSPEGQRLAGTLTLPADAAELVGEALG